MYKEKERGSILIYSLLMLTIITGTAFALARVFLPELHNIKNTSNSTIAIYAADSASELCLYEARKQIMPNPRLVFTNTASFHIASESSPTEVDVTNDCRPLAPRNFKFRASGVLGSVQRALEVTE